MTKRTLRELAQSMRAALADRNGYQDVNLSGGLEVVLSRTMSQWTLALKRADRYPSAQELSICRAAFDVPAEPHMTPFERQMPSPKTRAMQQYKGVLLRWREYPEATR